MRAFVVGKTADALGIVQFERQRVTNVNGPWIVHVTYQYMHMYQGLCRAAPSNRPDTVQNIILSPST